jgi:hypothetical protein
VPGDSQEKDDAHRLLETRILELTRKVEVLQQGNAHLKHENALLSTHSQLSSFSEEIIDVRDEIKKALLGVEDACLNLSLALPEAIGECTVPSPSTPLEVLCVHTDGLWDLQKDAFDKQVTLNIFAEKIIVHAWIHWMVKIWRPFSPGEYAQMTGAATADVKIASSLAAVFPLSFYTGRGSKHTVALRGVGLIKRFPTFASWREGGENFASWIQSRIFVSLSDIRVESFARSTANQAC